MPKWCVYAEVMCLYRSDVSIVVELSAPLRLYACMSYYYTTYYYTTYYYTTYYYIVYSPCLRRRHNRH
jgi:hypothetical protein